MNHTADNTRSDPAELAHFNALSDHWWDPEGPLKTLHHINPLRADYVDERAGGVADRTLLDIGCGGGLLSEAMAVRGARVTGIDLGEGAIAAARDHARSSGLTDIDYEVMDCSDLAREKPAAFDVVTCLELLEHVPEPERIVKAAATLVAPGGHVVFSTLNRNLWSFASAILSAEYLMRLIPTGTHDYLKFIRPSELAAWARASGLTVRHECGIAYNPITRKARRLDRTPVNYLIHCQRMP